MPNENNPTEPEASSLSHLYQSAGEYAHDAADYARDGMQTAGRFARRAGSSGVSFLGAHALPLTMIGLGVGWLALSMQQQSRLRALELDYRRSQRLPSLRGEYRRPIASEYRPSEQGASHESDGTNRSPKLLGVRTIEVGNEAELGPTP